jgi:hypothetical protein
VNGAIGPQPRNPNWEKAFQPKIGASRLVLTLVVYMAWLGFLAYFAAERWFGALH